MTMEEIFYWKKELRRLSREFVKVWKHCPKCGEKWTSIGWDSESDHERLIVECRNSHLFFADDLFWLYSSDDDEVYAPKKEVVADACEA